DFFLSETAHHADLVFCGSMHEEDEGVICSAEGRVQKINKAVDPPGDAKSDALIICDLAKRLGKEQYFPFNSTKEIFEELRVASKGGVADYYGITWKRIEDEMGVFWPCPEVGHPGTPRLFENKRSFHPDGLFHLHPTAYRPSFEVPDEEYPLYYTTGRSVFHYLSGTQTRRIKFLVGKAHGPICENHTVLAERLALVDRQLVTLETRRDHLTLPLQITEGIRPDTVFVPYH